MKLNIKEEPRVFFVGNNEEIEIKDYGTVHLDENEQISFITEDGGEYDVCKKNWGYYATPSIKHRLKNNGFLSALVRNANDQIYLWIIEKEKMDLFEIYLKENNHSVIEWLCPSETSRRCICGSYVFDKKHTYNHRPEGETDFNIKNYYRELWQCNKCNHFILIHNYDMESLYESDYVSQTYKRDIKVIFDKIINLPAEKSDNYHRVKNIKNYLLSEDKPKSVLDVGSGLCVFLYLLQAETDWNCYALDPDELQAEHAKSLKINAVCSDFKSFDSKGKKFNLITFNKVLEHIKDPISFLLKAKDLLEEDGVIYIELPDGETAYFDSVQREEFFMEHYHAFSLESMLVMARISDLKVMNLERVVEPSGKYTLRMFCRKKG